MVGVAASQTVGWPGRGLRSTKGVMDKQTHSSLCCAVQVLSSDMLNLQFCNVRADQ